MATRGRKPKPTALKLLEGNVVKEGRTNKDGVCDTRDLVLLAQSAAYDKQ